MNVSMTMRRWVAGSAAFLGLMLSGGTLASAAPAPPEADAAAAASSAAVADSVARSSMAVAESIVRSGAKSGVTAAAGNWYRCPSGYFCIFADYNGTGVMAYYRTGTPDLNWQAMDKSASSYWNRSGRYFCAYPLKYYGGKMHKTDIGLRLNLNWASNDNNWSSLRAC